MRRALTAGLAAAAILLPAAVRAQDIRLTGRIEHPRTVTMAELRAMPATTLKLTQQAGPRATGELDPELEGKQVLIAWPRDGQPLATPQIVVPGDKRAGRGVHDVVEIEVR